MLQLEKDLLEIQLQVSKWQPVIRKIMNPLYGYVQCSYLISNASTYLDTNYIPNTETKLDIKFKLNNLDDNNICFSDNFGIGIRNSKLAYMFGEELVITDVDASVDAIYEVQLSKNGLFVNNLQVVERFSTSIDFISDKTLLLGAGYDNDDVEILNSKNIYYCKVYDVDEFEYPVMEDGNMIMSVLNQVNLVDDTFESFGGTDTEIKDTLDEVMNKPKTKSNIPDLVRNYTCVRTDADTEEDYVYGFWNYADKKFYTATEGNYKGKDDIEYVELEYLQSSGNQFISIDYIPKTLHTKYELGFMRLQANGTWNPIINSEEDVRFGMCCTRQNETNLGEFWVGPTSNYKSVTFPVSDNVKYDIIADKTGISLNGTKYTIATPSDATGQWSTCINHRRTGATTFSSEYSIGRWYYLKVFEDDNLIKNFIPVIRKSDNAVCMYDKVSNTFFTNIGTGNFTAGPEK